MVTLWCRCIPDGKYQQAMGMAVEARYVFVLSSAHYITNMGVAYFRYSVHYAG
jgi:hypothetical protein